MSILISQFIPLHHPPGFPPNQQTFNVSQFWKLEVQNQGVNRAMLSLKALGKKLVFTPSLHHSQK